jgi:hypothetical protein
MPRKLFITAFIGLISIIFLATSRASPPKFSFIITAKEGAVTKLFGNKKQYMLTIKKSDIHKPVIVILNKPYRVVDHVLINDFINWKIWQRNNTNSKFSPIKGSLSAHDLKTTPIILNIKPFFDKKNQKYIIYFLWNHTNKFASAAVLAHKVTLVVDNIHSESSSISD